MGSGCDAVLVQSLLWHASTLNHFQEVKTPPTHIGQSNKIRGKKNSEEVLVTSLFQH